MNFTAAQVKTLRKICTLLCAALLVVMPNAVGAIAEHQHMTKTRFAPATSPEQTSQPLPQVQLFDMQQERIVKTLPNTPAVQAEATKWLQSVTGLSPQLNIGSKCGYIVRIALANPFQVKLPRIDFQTNDVFLIYCPDKKPLLLVFTPERKPFLLEFKHNVQPFMEELMKPMLPGAEQQ
ncbi:type IV secretion system protein VirB6 [Paenibacillus agilis]|uniref:Type IV secretion system protein VirB6 n=1 Tax=Paenibacillus agilis TaxID=3020863 RepID=A0A559IZ91_9BACL|nr:type IV secretion system protein VirB6 [Paenibacillus agilis]TVX92945.1 type IV secretion system protein VirB6 [Paenibacillus agilis]